MFVSIKSWQPKDGFTFEPTAMEIIKSNFNTALLAGPGAGKTEVLAQRACFLLETGSSPWPKNILSITRKREAASNIKERVELRCGTWLSYRFHSFTIESFTKGILDRFISVLPVDQRPNREYKIEFNASNASFPESLTFDQITLKAHWIMSHSPVILKAIRTTYSHVFIDEFQDLNQIQYDFINLLFCNTACVSTVVGDTKQAIMKFAQALPDIFNRFENDFSAKFLPLWINHRSSPELQSFLFRLSQKWWPGQNFVVDALTLPNHKYSICCYQDEEHEASVLSRMIQKWINVEGIPANEIAVLFRVNTNNSYSGYLSRALNELNILNINESVLQDHLSEPIGKLLLYLLRLLTRPRDAFAWEKLCELSVFCRSNSDMKKNEILILKIMDFIERNRSHIDNSINDNNLIYEIAQEFFNTFFTGYLEATWPQYAHGDFAFATLVGIIEELGKNKKTENTWGDAVDLISGVNAVRLMTIHKSKGLEFEAVILLGFEDFPYFRFGSNQKKMDEERSTIFVALSRAKRRLWISAASHRNHTGISYFSHMRTIIDDICEHGFAKNVVTLGQN